MQIISVLVEDVGLIRVFLQRIAVCDYIGSAGFFE